MREYHPIGKTKWKSWMRSGATAVVVLVAVVGGILVYARAWPALVIAESSSMAHGHATSHIGTIDVGDIVFVQSAPTRTDVVTYVEGRNLHYSTYGDYGDVILFRLANDPSAMPVLHRAIMYLVPNRTGADVPGLANLPTSDWQGYRGGVRVNSTEDLTAVAIRGMGYNHDLDISFDLSYFVRSFPGRAGYVTMGDNNAYEGCNSQPCTPPYDTSWFPGQNDVIGHGRGEIPWFGLVKLVLVPTATCAHSWADPCAPLNSWDDLALSLAAILTLPFILEAGMWVWSTYAWPNIRPHLTLVRGKITGAPSTRGKLATEPELAKPGKRSSGEREPLQRSRR